MIFCLAIGTLIPYTSFSKGKLVMVVNCDVADKKLDCDNDGTLNGEDIAPLDPCIGGKTPPAENDCDGDGVTVGQGDLDDNDFCVPNPQLACENFQATAVEIEEEVDFEEDLIVVESEGVTAIINNPCPTEVADYGDCDGDGTPNNLDEDPFDACTGWTNQLPDNDCDGDGITVGQGDIDDYDFCVPNAQVDCESSSPIEGEEIEEFDLDINDNNGIAATINTVVECADALDPNDCDGDGTPNDTDEDPLDPCTGGSQLLDGNDCDGDGITVGQGDMDDYDFCVPNAQPGCETSSPIEGEEIIEFDLDVTDNNGIAATINTVVECADALDPNDCDGDGTPNDTDEDPFDPCTGGSQLLDGNDCDGDGITVGQGDTDDYDYCIPNEKPECTVEANNAIDAQTILIAPCDDTPTCYVTVAIKALLQGAYDEDNPSIMRDDLRALNLLPLKEPYKDLKIYDGDPIPFKVLGQGEEMVQKEVLEVTGDNAIVDWVFIQLHAENDPTKIIATRSALIQRDGDIVDTDGSSPVKFQYAPGRYYVSVRHRNHLGVMTRNAVILSKNMTTSIDFSDINSATYTLDDPRKKSNHAQRRIDDLNYLWGGNSNGDWATIYQGPGLDQTKVFYDIFVDDNNKGPDGFPNYNYIKRGYTISDSNMDGEVRYQGPNNDVDELQFFNIILHPDNPGFFSNKIIYEQIPIKREE